MLKGIYDTASGMLPQIVRLDTVANNLANANTAGFKRELVFSQEFSKAQQQTLAKEADWEQVQVTGVVTDFAPGPIARTGSPLDLAIEGDGFFVVSTPQGEMYTRGGNFTISAQGKLVTQDGHPVLGEGGELTIEGNDLAVDQRGNVTVDRRPVGQLKLVTFAQPYPLVRTAPGLFAVAGDAGTPAKAEKCTVIQGAVESSNTNMISEMIEMIEGYRNFETGQRMIQIQDESLGKAVNQLGAVRR